MRGFGDHFHGPDRRSDRNDGREGPCAAGSESRGAAHDSRKRRHRRRGGTAWEGGCANRLSLNPEGCGGGGGARPWGRGRPERIAFRVLDGAPRGAAGLLEYGRVCGTVSRASEAHLVSG